jgi:hypothetical protein
VIQLRDTNNDAKLPSKGTRGITSLWDDEGCCVVVGMCVGVGDDASCIDDGSISDSEGGKIDFTGDKVDGICVIGSSVGIYVGGDVIAGNPKMPRTNIKFSFRSSLSVTSIDEQSGKWQPRVKMLMTLSKNDSSVIPLSTNCCRLEM